jgi:MFS family permease
MSLLAIYVLSGPTGIGIGIAAPLIPLLLQQKGASGGAIGLAASVIFAASIVGPTSVGVVMDRYGARMMCGPLLTIAVAFVVLMMVDAFLRGRLRYVVARAKDAAV